MDKNRNRIISLVIIVLLAAAIVLALVLVKRYGGKTQNNMDNVSEDSRKDNNLNNMSGKNDNEMDKLAKTDYESEKTRDVISSKTKLIMQTYYIDARNHENLEEVKENMPAKFIAMDEDELEDYLEEYVEDMPLNEYLDGLLSYEIVDFSKDKVILRKTYAADWNENEYFVCDKNGLVVVYYSDKETVFDYTGIKTAELPSEEQVRLKIGYFVTNDEELYALLESYSS